MWRRTGLTLLVAIVSTLPSCASLPRLDYPPAYSSAVVPVGFPASVRVRGVDWRTEAPPEQIIGRLQTAATDGSFDILALSGGGASGAFGAGALVGLTKAHARPQFELVTGVSTGALIAPFAFLGSSWDAALTDAFVGGLCSDLMQRDALGALFGSSVFDGGPLRRLIDNFVTPRMIEQVAREAARGRILLVATTDLDRSEAVVWNMGVIAATGGEHARQLFRDVLVASASVPGVFPPVLLPVADAKGHLYEEMHVDGATSVPFFVAPEAVLVAPGVPWGAGGGNIYVVINSDLNVMSKTTPLNTFAIFERGFSSALSHASRTALAQTAAYAQKLGMSFHYTAIPGNDGFAGFLDFERPKMQALFNYASGCAEKGQLWLSKMQQALDLATNPGTATGPLAPECPVDSAVTAKHGM